MANRASVRDPQVIRFVIDSVANVTGPTYAVLQDCEIIGVTVVSTAAQPCTITLLRGADTVSVVPTAGADGSIGTWTTVDTAASRVYVTAGQVLQARTGNAATRAEAWVTVLPGLTASL
jgi:hypothetical protein